MNALFAPICTMNPPRTADSNAVIEHVKLPDLHSTPPGLHASLASSLSTDAHTIAAVQDLYFPPTLATSATTDDENVQCSESCSAVSTLCSVVAKHYTKNPESHTVFVTGAAGDRGRWGSV